MAPALGLELAATTELWKPQQPIWQGTSSPLEGWPSHLEATLVWDGAQYQHEDEYICYIDKQQQEEVESALQAFKDLGLDAHEVDRSNFPLPSLQNCLGGLARNLHKGKGFVILRGLKFRSLSLEDNIIIYLGISSYFGEKRGKQDHEGNMLIHIRNAMKMEASQEDRPARDSNRALAFHTDLWADILALQTLSCAAQGGSHVIAPAYTIYNELAATRPDLLEALVSPDWFFDEHSLHSTQEMRPLISYHHGRVLFNFGLLHVFEDSNDAKRRLSQKQLESMAYIQKLARKYQLRLPLQPGDMCFINNFAILHAREAFLDAPGKTRHMVRLWLKNESLAWRLPPHLDKGNQKVFYDESLQQLWEIAPPPRLGFKIQDMFSP